MNESVIAETLDTQEGRKSLAAAMIQNLNGAVIDKEIMDKHEYPQEKMENDVVNYFYMIKEKIDDNTADESVKQIYNRMAVHKSKANEILVKRGIINP